MGFVKFDFYDMNNFYDSLFEEVEDKPLSANFEAVGYESQYFLRNYGSAFAFVLVFLVYAILAVLISFCCGKRDNKVARKARSVAKAYFWNSPIALVNESFLLTLLSAIVNIQLEFNFKTTFNSLCIGLSLVGAFLSIATLIFFPVLYCNRLNFKKITEDDILTDDETEKEAADEKDKERIEKYGMLLDNLDLERKSKKVVILTFIMSFV
jgi:uncharacterized membrane protein